MHGAGCRYRIGLTVIDGNGDGPVRVNGLAGTVGKTHLCEGGLIIGQGGVAGQLKFPACSIVGCGAYARRKVLEDTERIIALAV